MGRAFWVRLWGSLEEPRKVTALMVFAYAVAVVSAYMTLAMPNPHPFPWADRLLSVLGAVLMSLGGLVGMPTAWTGKWWIERGAATACLGGVGLSVFEAVVLAWPGPPELVAPALTLPAVAFSVLLFAARLLRVTGRPYAPGKGPVTPDDKAAEVLAAMVAHEHRDKAWG